MPTKASLRRRQVAVYALAVAVAAGLGIGRPAAAGALERLVTPALAVLLYATFLEVPFVRFRRAFTDARFLGAALAVNFLAVPAVAWALTRPLAGQPTVLVGALLVLLTPCIDYVIAFTELADGDAERLTAATPVLLAAQFLLLPAYLWAFVGERIADAIEPGPFLEALLLLIAGPLALAWLTEVWAERSPRGARWKAATEWLPVPAMAATLLVVIASQLPRVLGAADRVVAVVPVYVAFLAIMPLVGRAVADRLAMDVGERRALVFTSVTRNSLVVLPIGLALPTPYELVPAVVVTQTLVELCGMVVLTELVPTRLVPDPPGQRERIGEN